MKTPKRPVGLMTLAQGVCILAIPLTMYFFLSGALDSFMNYRIMDQLGLREESILLDVILAAMLLRDAAIGLCLMLAEIDAFRICARVKRASAFSELNVNGLGRMTRLLVIAGGIALVLGSGFFPLLMAGLPPISPVIEHLLLPFMLWTLALMVRAVQVLMRRALTMEEENELTV